MSKTSGLDTNLNFFGAFCGFVLCLLWFRALVRRPQNDFSKLRAILDQLMRLPRLAECQHAINDSTDLPLLDKFHRLEQFRFRTHKRAEYVQVSIEDLT